MDMRKVLCFNFSAARNESLDSMRALDWTIISTGDLNEAKDLIDQHRFKVGMVYFGSTLQNDLSSIRDLFTAQRPMEWIGLLPAEAVNRPDLCELISRHFYDYHTLPLDPGRLQLTLGHALGMADMLARTAATSPQRSLDELVGCSPPSLRLFRTIKKVAAIDAPVLIIGESGAGKESTALAIHRASARAERPFVKVSCDGLPSEVIRAELFGYGNSTEIRNREPTHGRLAAANGGTLFLDEVGNLTEDLQSDLLGFFREGTVPSTRGDGNIPVDVRILAATQTDLEQTVTDGRFRDDLYRRLKTLSIQVPPLRDRQDDIELLAKHYLRLLASGDSGSALSFEPEALKAMRHYEWPGNIRELINRIKRAKVMCEGPAISSADLGLNDFHSGFGRTFDHPVTLEEAKDQTEKEVIQLTLQATENNISRAARQLAVSRMTLYRLMYKHQIRNSNWVGENLGIAARE
ncbi:sigma-54 factor interaction domain-containing protein [Methylocaldum marinum]|uniref:Sigma-54 factor interaction domain-containing protein n=1 Tax=Methylocaldum marinum TaxID=1432792 RepID=A0A250KUF4_9GAMM|nr:sigma-54 dependent transcriptional regulator [Methylocaldum marinum]BBA35212.1 sigma-54 factor interaction domain-containing protein [Methylocaldum marinum]